MAIGFATSCSDDDNKGGTSGTLEGKWIYDKEGLSGMGREQLNPYNHQQGCDKDYIEILTNNIVKAYIHESDSTVTPEQDTFTRNGNSFTIGTGADAETGTIETLTETDLKLKFSETIEGQTFSYITTYKRG